MNKITYTIIALMAFALTANAQVGIETDQVSPKAILDFPDNADGGILLPYVENPTTAGNVAGTLIYNASDGKVYYQNNKQDWIAINPAPQNAANIAEHDSTLTELDSEGILISEDGTQTASGVLVLEASTKALALPKVNGVENIQSPTTGMICYDSKRKALAIFNGEQWFLRN